MYTTKQYNISNDLLININKLINNEYDTSQDIKLRDNTPKILVQNGIDNLPMLMNSTHVLSNILKEEDAKKMNLYRKDTNYHELGIKKFIEVIDSIDNPVAVYKHKNLKDYIILTEKINDYNEKIIVTIYIQTKGNYNRVRMDTNKIKSIYGKNNVDKYINKNIKQGIFTEIYKKSDLRHWKPIFQRDKTDL